MEVQRGRRAWKGGDHTTRRLHNSLDLVDPWMRAGWRVKGPAEVSKPGTGHTWEFKTRQKVVQFWDWLMLGTHGTDKTVAELGNCHGSHSWSHWNKQIDHPARGAQREEVWAHSTGVTTFRKQGGYEWQEDRRRSRRKWAHGSWSAVLRRDG